MLLLLRLFFYIHKTKFQLNQECIQKIVEKLSIKFYKYNYSTYLKICGLTNVRTSWNALRKAPNKNIGPKVFTNAGNIEACFFVVLPTKSTLAGSVLYVAFVCCMLWVLKIYGIRIIVLIFYICICHTHGPFWQFSANFYRILALLHKRYLPGSCPINLSFPKDFDILSMPKRQTTNTQSLQENYFLIPGKDSVIRSQRDIRPIILNLNRILHHFLDILILSVVYQRNSSKTAALILLGNKLYNLYN